MRPWVKRLSAAALPSALFAADRIAKHYALTALPQDGGAVLIDGFAFGLYRNRGLLFSTFDQAVAAIATALALAALCAYAIGEIRKGRAFTPWQVAGASLILLGGASNAYDRFFLGSVTDYFLFLRSAWNIADIMILAGIAILFMRRGPKGDKPPAVR